MPIIRNGVLAAAMAALMLPIAAGAATLTVSGSTTVASSVMMPKQGEIEAASGISLKIVANGSSRGIDDLVSGRSTLAMISAPLDVTVAGINSKTPGRLDGVDLRGHQIGETRVSFVVHPANPVTSLTLEQVAGILTGQVTNWAALGGPDMPIVIVAETAGGGVRSLVESRLIPGASITGTLREFPNATQVPRVAAQMPQAFGIAAAVAAGADSARVVRTDAPVAQPLILVTIGAPTEDMRAVIRASRAAGS